MESSISMMVTQNLKRLDLNQAPRRRSYFVCKSLNAYQELCEDLGLPGDLPSKAACRKALTGVRVNIKQLLACKNPPEDVIFFKSSQDLANYTFKNNAIYPRKKARNIAAGSLCREII